VLTGLRDVMQQFEADERKWTTQQLMNRIVSVKQMGYSGEDFWGLDCDEEDLGKEGPISAIQEALVLISTKEAQLEQCHSHNAEVAADL
jgi:hypothetical protein